MAGTTSAIWEQTYRRQAARSSYEFPLTGYWSWRRSEAHPWQIAVPSLTAAQSTIPPWAGDDWRSALAGSSAGGYGQTQRRRYSVGYAGLAEPDCGRVRPRPARFCSDRPVTAAGTAVVARERL